MVSFQTVQQSNAILSNLPPGFVALFVGATSGIGQSSLQHLAHHASSPRIYTVARPATTASHENLLASLRQSNPNGTYNLITADISLISEVDKVVKEVKARESSIDLLYMSPGFIAFEGRNNTTEGLDPSMTTRYYSRLRLTQQLLPLLKKGAGRVISVLAAGYESPIDENDLDLRKPGSWDYWKASVHTATMGTLAFENIAQENCGLSIVHWAPGPVDTPGLARVKKFGMNPGNAMTQEEAGARALFLATNDRYKVEAGAGLVPVPEGLRSVEKSGGGIFLTDAGCESIDNEKVMIGLRESGLGDKVWKFTTDLFEQCVKKVETDKDEL